MSGRRMKTRLLGRGRRGFTLVEMTVSLAIVSILAVAVGAALRLGLAAAGAAPGAGAVNAAGQATAAEAADQIAADLNVALDFTEKTPTALTFTVPNRDGDGRPETIRYAWSGANGDASLTPPAPPWTLTREYNGGPWAALARNVRSCDFRLLYRDIAGAPVAPAPQVLLSFDPVGGAGSQAWVDPTTSAAVGFQLASAGSFTVTEISIDLLSAPTPDGIVKVQFCDADASNRPTAVREEAQIPCLAGSDVGTWVTASFKTLSRLDRSKHYAVNVVGYRGSAKSGGVVLAPGRPGGATAYAWAPGGWSATSSCMRVYVRGTSP